MKDEDWLESLLKELQRVRMFREMGRNIGMASIFTNLVIILPKRDIVKMAIDTQYLNSFTDLSNYSWLLEQVQSLLTRLDRVYYTTSNLTSACNQVLLSEDTKMLSNFVVGGKQNMFERGSHGLPILHVFQISFVESWQSVSMQWWQEASFHKRWLCYLPSKNRKKTGGNF